MKKQSRLSATLGILLFLVGFLLGVLSQKLPVEYSSSEPYSQEMELLRDL